ncbi:bifunctional 2-C-methyl-D-erythritol 4-phosphate cytidylyltransferase/2-C-methyl-D-erythritol 2,4-cyclodiphosphate synthase [Aureimonas ureilytica]|uniref:bifunctional 2-C-methyl-D-erythritol 4-phosphate cytidylyltransferase/2-C-methyl-D-erythritol 2,4-cyclodiphosphate synthase n=1 Tax=Aureimonas ureilytica TaxID=401562 RepID=UPI0003691729|nr:bifunctional 2-C-methyl-D-erythritol 4-phosphate cytidylyltransferase/2-C-methyl-D-erythritol 2,4-cyclodiphosphate synthase [Aureimonas ureilytica]
MHQSKTAVVIVAAGRGERAGQSVEGPKQYRRIGGRPVLQWTVEAFLRDFAFSSIVVLVHPDDIERAQAALSPFGDRVRLVVGSVTRQASVLKGLEALQASRPDSVLIHDGVRPFVSRQVIASVMDAITPEIGAIPSVPVSDTIKRMADGGFIAGTVDRKSLYAAQTPQGFPFDLILEAHEAAARETSLSFTDDASLFEWRNLPVALVPGEIGNVKLTLADDIVAADTRLRSTSGMIDVRTGNGYDVHQLVEGDHVTLCGVKIAHDQALLGHSDADVGLHALTDALLATCGAGDIGTHFPPSDPQWKGMASSLFVRRAVEIVREKGGRICNVDVTLIAEAPKVGPHRPAMVAAIGEMTGLEPERISIKATTNEMLGFIGRREGIAAIATASVVYGDRDTSL